MPFKSEAQRRKFHAMAGRGEISKKTVEHWEDATPKGKKLPEHVKKAVEKLVTQFVPIQVPVTVPSMSTISTPPLTTAGVPTLAKLKAQATRKIGEDIASHLKQNDRPDSDFRPDQLAKGIKVEREHSEELPVRKAISKGHLAEFENYYTALDSMEEKLKEGKTAAYNVGVSSAMNTLRIHNK